jgi:hypothetical protein
MDDPTKFLHISNAEVASCWNQPKYDPTGKSKLNPCLQTTPDGTIIRNPEFIPLLEETHAWIKR